MLRPAVSILVPSYNHAEFIGAAIESVLAQTFTDWELIIVDDGSEDSTVAAARAYASRDPRIGIWVNERNIGTYGTLCRARERADARYIAVLNSDDLWLPEKLARQVQFLNANPGIPLCYTLGWKVDADGQPDETEDVHVDWPTEPVQELLPRLLYENRVLASSVLFRPEAAEFDPSLRYSGDWVALLRAAEESPLGCVAERLTRWRMHPTNSFVRSVMQVGEEVRVRTAILERPLGWFVERVPAREIAEGLGQNALALAALEMLRGRRGPAIHAASQALKYLPAKRSALRRLGACLLPNGREILWPGDRTVFDRPAAPLPLSFL